MAFQLNGSTWIDSNGHFQQGFKTVNGTALAGSGNIVTGPGSAASFGTNWNVVGCLTIGYVEATFSYSGVFVTNGLYSSGYQRKGPEPGQNISGSDIYQPTYSTSQAIYNFVNDSAHSVGYIQNPSGHSGLSGTWRSLTPSHEDPTWSWDTYDLFIRIS